MTESAASTSTFSAASADSDLKQLIHAGVSDARVAQGLAAFRVASLLVPMPVVTYRPTTQSTTTSFSPA